MEQETPFWKQAAIFILELAFVVNVIFIDVLLFVQVSKQSGPKAATITQPTGTLQPTIINPIPTTVPTPLPTSAPTVIYQQTGSTTNVKESYIPLGSGQSQSQTYENINGAQAYIDSTKYSNIKTVTFEVSVFIPTGNETAWVQLYDVTQGHPVWNSEMSWNGGSAQYLVSSSITLDSGNNLYQVQMKTQLPSYAQLNQSKVHITLQ